VNIFQVIYKKKIFNSKWWDYSHFRFNISGRVNLQLSMFFVIVALAWYIFYYELTIKIFNSINYSLLETISIILIIFMLYDIFISSMAVYRTKERRKKIIRNGKFWKYIDKKYPDDKVLKVYANIKFI